ncbi:MAG: FKBP-type peptidyl-prolyl cis-trans isomerase [Bacteroidales bacterium]|jgi:FKBP-type peptidyl-prolyl cis-trans isomerase
MRKTILSNSIFLFAVMIFFSACHLKYPGYKKTKNGLYYKFIKRNSSAVKAKIGDLVVCQMVYTTEKDSELYSSIKANVPIHIQIIKPLYKGDINEAFEYMGLHDSAVFIVSADSFFFKNVKAEKLPSPLKSGSIMKIHIRIDSIKTKVEFEKEQQMYTEALKKQLEEMKNNEPALLDDYLKRMKIKAKPKESGLYFIELRKGKGKKISEGDSVRFNYAAFFVDGRLFDTNIEDTAKNYNLYSTKVIYRPVDCKFGTNKFIKGFEEGLSMMNIGSKAKLIIPSKIGYGEEGIENKIAPYTTLIYEVEVLKVY